MGNQFDYQKLDPLIHSKIRLGIISFLFRIEEAEFNELKSQLKATDGNLSVHLSKLEENGYIGMRKYFKGKIPCTSYSITEKGRKAFTAYIKELEHLITQVED